jgi:hypothetical protein
LGFDKKLFTNNIESNAMNFSKIEVVEKYIRFLKMKLKGVVILYHPLQPPHMWGGEMKVSHLWELRSIREFLEE